jgi:hypothetical protein
MSCMPMDRHDGATSSLVGYFEIHAACPAGPEKQGRPTRTYSIRSQISVHLALKSVYKRVYFSLFSAYLSSKKYFSLIT